MKIATFNVNGIKTRLPNLLEWLEREQPDVACLQELKVLDGMFPHAALRDAGYRALWKGQRSWNGVAILAKDADPVEIRRDLPGDPGDEHSRYIEAAIDGIVVACLYLPNGTIRSAICIPRKRFSRFGTTSAGTGTATAACASIICCSMPSSRRALCKAAWTAGCAGRNMPATTPPCG